MGVSEREREKDDQDYRAVEGKEQRMKSILPIQSSSSSSSGEREGVLLLRLDTCLSSVFTVNLLRKSVNCD